MKYYLYWLKLLICLAQNHFEYEPEGKPYHWYESELIEIRVNGLRLYRAYGVSAEVWRYSLRYMAIEPTQAANPTLK